MRQNTSLQRHLHDIAESEVPSDSLDLSLPIRQRAQNLLAAQRAERHSPRQRLVRVAMIAACVLALFAVGSQLLPGRTPSVSAKEALQRAEQSTTFGLKGIKSLHGVMEDMVPATGSTTREEYWVALPSHMRKDVVWPATATSKEQFQTEITDGKNAWIWSTDHPKATPETVSRLDLSEMDTALYVIPNPSASLDTPADPKAGLCSQPGDQLTSLGEERMFGRTALVIDCHIAPDASSLAGTHLKLWIDKDIFVVLKAQQFEANGDLFVQSAFTQFEIDGAISPDTFAPPAGVPVEGATK